VPYVNESRGPGTGGCLLQVVSALAREPWTDHPTCVHPALGAIARVAHDYSTEAGQRALRPLAPMFIGTARPGFDTSARLVALCVSTALASPDRRCISTDEMHRLQSSRETAMHLLRTREAAPGNAAATEDEEPRLCGAARWWFPLLRPLRLSEPFYRCWVAGEQAAEAVAVTARASGGDADRRIRQLVKVCLSVSGNADHPARAG
jgi:hypothetical protein